jgi:hypothetical protein
MEEGNILHNVIVCCCLYEQCFFFRKFPYAFIKWWSVALTEMDLFVFGLVSIGKNQIQCDASRIGLE